MSLAHVSPVIADRVRTRLVDEGSEPSIASVMRALRAEGLVLGDHAVRQLASALHSDMLGAGPLQPLLSDTSVTDILVNSPAEVWVDRGAGLERAPVAFPDEESVRRLAQRLASAAGRRLDDAMPFVDARLPEGVRLHAVLSPLASPGTVISLRIPSAKPFGLADLEAAGMFGDYGSDVLARLVASRASFLVTGGTGSGKTTLLNALLGLVPATERLVLVEDTAELAPVHPHVVSLQSRPPNSEGRGGHDLRALVRQALRMRPDRLVVGEVRGAEVVDLLAALNTGHEGGCATIHARSAAALPARMEALGLMAGVSREAVGALLVAGIEFVVHVDRHAADASVGATRRLAEVAALRWGDGGGPPVAEAVIRFGREPGGTGRFGAREAPQAGPAFEVGRERLGLEEP